jgi:signal transduction histidine kinase
MLLNNVTGPVSDPQRKSLSRIDSNARHLLALINDILDITRIEAGRMPLNATTFGVGELFEEVQSELEPIIKRSNLAVSTKLRGAVPSVRSDRQKVKQIVLNLLSNALKFTPAGSVLMTASYDARLRQMAIAVKDTGVGIPEDDQVKVFEDFRQLDSSPARGYGGTGLGLSICRRLAQILGGTIDLQSKPGHGSTFTLRLPAKARRR